MKSTMKIYNTMTKKKEELLSISKNKINLYACGITPYDDVHLGHAMQAVIFDTIRRYFEYKGYQVKYVRNYTDVDDKIIDRAKEKGVSPLELSKNFILRSQNDLKKLKIRPATFEPLVSEHIDDIINFVKDLIEKDYAYESNGSVYFNVLNFKEYGKLSHRTLEDLKPEGDFEADKKNHYDFALWKLAKEGEVFWDSPWGKGRPGWHIECSTLSQKYLGDTIDIHGGGRDLVFPHHENEIAQSEAKTGVKFANYWMHNGLVTINKQKMSKSSGNFFTVEDLLKKYTADVLRFLIFSFSYGANLNFNERDLLVIDKRLYGFYNTLDKLDFISEISEKSINKLNLASKSFIDNFEKYMDDNFSTPRIIAELNKFFSVLQPIVFQNTKTKKGNNLVKKIVIETLNPFWKVFGILDEEAAKYIKEMHNKILNRLNIQKESVQLLLDERSLARRNKDFEKSDKFRDKLLNLGIEVLDNPDGSYSWFQKV